MRYLKLARHLISVNPELVEKTAIRDCHCLGLHSFIINGTPKIRLFIADDDSELHGRGIQLPVPIHAHKYDELFQVISGKVHHDVFSTDPRSVSLRHAHYNAYTYSRIGDDGTGKPEYRGMTSLSFIEKIKKNQWLMPANVLHSVRLTGKNVMWLVTELDKSEDFKQLAFLPLGQELKPRQELYKKFPNALDYINKKMGAAQ